MTRSSIRSRSRISVSRRQASPRSQASLRSCHAAFSLLELLLVLVILAVLAAVVVPKFVGRSEQARITAATVDVANIETALEAFEIDTGRFPEAAEGLEALIEQPPDLENWRGPYLKRGIPQDPWGRDYVYEYPGRQNESGYDLHSFGPDGQDGTDDDVVNWQTDNDER